MDNIIDYTKAVALLEMYYEDVESIDLIVGSLLEPLVPDGMIGETSRCILADGFFRIRYGDRFFCDVQGQPGSFTDGIMLITLEFIK